LETATCNKILVRLVSLYAKIHMIFSAVQIG